MKRLLFAVAAITLSASAFAADVGVSVNIGEPGFYGRVDIGDFPQPRVIYRDPVVVEHVIVEHEPPPLYLRVPPGHAKHWSKHCREYDACGRPVYFVRDDWYQKVYVPRWHERHHDREDEHHGRDEDRHDEGEHHGHGEGHGRGHDKHDRD